MKMTESNRVVIISCLKTWKVRWWLAPLCIKNTSASRRFATHGRRRPYPHLESRPIPSELRYALQKRAAALAAKYKTTSEVRRALETLSKNSCFMSQFMGLLRLLALGLSLCCRAMGLTGAARDTRAELLASGWDGAFLKDVGVPSGLVSVARFDRDGCAAPLTSSVVRDEVKTRWPLKTDDLRTTTLSRVCRRKSSGRLAIFGPPANATRSWS